MRLALLILSVLALVLLLTAQVGTYLEFVLVPAPTPATTGPQGPADLVFGLMALVGGGLGLAASVATGIVGLLVASSEGRRSWLIAIAASGALVVIGLGVSAFVMLELARNAYHPFTVCLVVPITTLAYLASNRRPGQKPT